MSIRVMSRVWDDSQHKGNELIVLLAIADHADDSGTNAFPSIRRLAWKTRLSERTVQRSIQKCEASGELIADRPRIPGNLATVYTICLSALTPRQFDTPKRKGRVSSRQQGGVTAVTPTVLLKPAEDAPLPEEVNEVWDYTLAVLKSDYGVLKSNLDRLAELPVSLDGDTLVVRCPPEIATMWRVLLPKAAGRAVRFERG